MKRVMTALLSVAVLLILGTVLYQRLSPVMNGGTSELPVSAGTVMESTDQLPPVGDQQGNFPAVNQERIAQLAGQPYKGMNYKEDAAVVDRMVAEQRQAHLGSDQRLPASEQTAPAEKAPEAKKKAKKAPKKAKN